MEESNPWGDSEENKGGFSINKKDNNKNKKKPIEESDPFADSNDNDPFGGNNKKKGNKD